MKKLLEMPMIISLTAIQLTLFYYEMLFRLVSEIPFRLTDSLLIFVFTFACTCIIGLFLLLFKAKYKKIAALVMLVLMAILYGSQMVYYAIFGTIYTFFSFVNGQKAWSFFDVIVSEVNKLLPQLALLLIPLVLFYFFVPQDRQEISKPFKRLLTLIVTLFLAFNVGLYFVRHDQFGINSKFRLYYKDNNPLEATKRFGLITAMRLDVQHFLGVYEKEPLLTQTHVDYRNKNPQQRFAHLPIPSKYEKVEQVLNLDLQQLKQLTQSEDQNEVIDFFMQQTPTKTNAMTGAFKGYNLIYITAESLSKYSFHPTYTPTLYMMQEKGISFENFYTPLWGVSTSDGEYTSLLSLLPKSGVWSMFQSQDNALPFSLGNIYRHQRIPTYAFHNHDFTYYGRDKTHPNLGYSYIALGNGLQGISPGWPESDIEMFDNTFDYYINQEQFMVYYLTVSGHFPYNLKDNVIAQKNIHYLEKSDYSDEAKAFLATQIELDKALEKLLAKLREAGIAEKTLIVINPDHYPYALKKETLQELANDDLVNPSDIYKSQLIIYHDGITPKRVSKLCSSLDILPTMYNLLGLPFDSRLMMGTDIFSDQEGIVMFMDRSWMTNKGYYDSQLNQFIPNGQQAFDNVYAQAVSDKVLQKFKASEIILDSDFFAIFDFDKLIQQEIEP